MQVTETMTFDEYGADPRFESKSPIATVVGSKVAGTISTSEPHQRPSGSNEIPFTRPDGSLNPDHVTRDTGVNRVLISNDFVYFGGEGPEFPEELKDQQGRSLCKTGIGLTTFDDPKLIANLEQWVRSFGLNGYQGAPFEWLTLRR